MFLKPDHVKDYLLLLWAKFKKRYQVEIFEFIIMDNHAHVLLKAKSTEALGHFMRTVNSLLAKYINRTFKRDSQAIRERYKSPLIASSRYVRKVMQYIWLNRFKVNKLNPLSDRYCSASWRINHGIIAKLRFNSDESLLIKSLLDHDDLLYPASPKETRSFVRDLLNSALSIFCDRIDETMVHGHTIGDEESRGFRSELLSAFRRQRNPRPTWLF